MLALPDDVTLPDPRLLVPEMVAMQERHPDLNLLNIEAAAAASVLDARVLLSARAAEGLLADVLTAERLSWRVVEIG